MFKSKEELKKRTGADGLDRLPYLQRLVNEFQETSSEECKDQIVANLANFAFDPINFEYFKALNVLDIFLDCLTEKNEKLVQFAMGGICNFVNDPQIEETILKSDGLKLIINCFTTASNAEVIIQCLSVLFFLAPGLQQQHKQQLLLQLHTTRQSTDMRISNLCKVLEDALAK